ncbi:hypothetical protein MUTS15_71860 [Escherichia coli]|nr:hypothetical protein MUTS15_71860 [Escherichia coli]
MTGSQVIDAEEDRHKLVVEYKDALQPADFYHNFKQLGIRSVQLIPHLEFDDRGDLTAASVTAELWGKFLIALFECWVRADISRISIELLTPPYKNGVAAKSRNRAVTARRATGIACARTLGKINQTTCFVRAIRRFILTPRRICG